MLQGLDDALNNTKPTEIDDNKWKMMCHKTLITVRFYLLDEVKAPFKAETSSNDLWKKLEGMYLSKSMASRTALKKQLY